MYCNRCKRRGSHMTRDCRARTFPGGKPIGRPGQQKKTYGKYR